MADETPDLTVLLRPFNTETDATALVDLLKSVEAFDHDGEVVSEEAVADLLNIPGHDPVRDRWVAVEQNNPHALVGWSFVWVVPGETIATLTGAVSPPWRRHGIGRALLDLALTRAHELGASMAGIYAGAHNPVAQRFVSAAGFQPVSANTLLRVDQDVALPVPMFPHGFTLRQYSEVNALPVLATAFNRCYTGLWGHHTLSDDVLAQWAPTLQAEYIYLLFAPDMTIAGMCRIERVDEPVPYVDAPGVVPEYRANGLYAPLLLAACAAIRQTSSRAIEVESWGDAAETLAQYERLGFKIVRQSLAYERPLGSGFTTSEGDVG